jgi:ribosomal protein S18 acetylase RimI-like enzyme
MGNGCSASIKKEIHMKCHQGIGEQLMRHAYGIAQGLNCNQVNIGIVEENKVLRKWYEALGFVHMGTQKFDFFPFTCGYMERTI